MFQALINSLFVDFIQSVIQLFQPLINSLIVDFIQSVIQLFQVLINSLFVDFIQSVMQLFVCSCFLSQTQPNCCTCIPATSLNLNSPAATRNDHQNARRVAAGHSTPLSHHSAQKSVLQIPGRLPRPRVYWASSSWSLFSSPWSCPMCHT